MAVRPKKTLDPGLVNGATHGVWEFACRDELHDEMLPLVPSLAAVLLRPKLATSHANVLNILGLMATRDRFAVHFENLSEDLSLSVLLEKCLGARSPGRSATDLEAMQVEVAVATLLARLARCPEGRRVMIDCAPGQANKIDEGDEAVSGDAQVLGNFQHVQGVLMSSPMSDVRLLAMQSLVVLCDANTDDMASMLLNNDGMVDELRDSVEEALKLAVAAPFHMQRRDGPANLEVIRCIAEAYTRLTQLSVGPKILHSMYSQLTRMYDWLHNALYSVEAREYGVAKSHRAVMQKALVHTCVALVCAIEGVTEVAAMSWRLMKNKPGFPSGAQRVTMLLKLLTCADNTVVLTACAGLAIMATRARTSTERGLALAVASGRAVGPMLVRATRRRTPPRVREMTGTALCALASLRRRDLTGELWLESADDFAMDISALSSLFTERVIRVFISLTLSFASVAVLMCLRAGGAADSSSGAQLHATADVGAHAPTKPIGRRRMTALLTATATLMYMVCQPIPTHKEEPDKEKEKKSALSALVGSMKRAKYGRCRRPIVDMLCILLDWPNLRLLTYTTMGLWGVAHNTRNRQDVGESGAIQRLCGWLAVLVLARSNEPEPARADLMRPPTRDGDRGGQRVSTSHSDRQKRIAKFEADQVNSAAVNGLVSGLRQQSLRLGREEWQPPAEGTKESPEEKEMREVAAAQDVMRLVQQRMLGCLWLLIFDKGNIERFDQCGGIQVVCDTLHAALSTGDPNDMRLAYLCFGMLWTVSQNPRLRVQLLYEPARVPEAALTAADNPEQPDGVRVFAAGFLLELLRDREVQRRLAIDRGVDFTEQLVVNFLKSKDVATREYGAQVIAREFQEELKKRHLARLGGCKLLVKQLHMSPTPPEPLANARMAALHALLNVTTEEEAQRAVGKCGLARLVDLTQPPHTPEVKAFASRIVLNCKRHPANRAQLYREELRVKAPRWRARNIAIVADSEDSGLPARPLSSLSPEELLQPSTSGYIPPPSPIGARSAPRASAANPQSSQASLPPLEVGFAGSSGSRAGSVGGQSAKPRAVEAFEDWYKALNPSVLPYGKRSQLSHSMSVSEGMSTRGRVPMTPLRGGHLSQSVSMLEPPSPGRLRTSKGKTGRSIGFSTLGGTLGQSTMRPGEASGEEAGKLSTKLLRQSLSATAPSKYGGIGEEMSLRVLKGNQSLHSSLSKGFTSLWEKSLQEDMGEQETGPQNMDKDEDDKVGLAAVKGLLLARRFAKKLRKKAVETRTKREEEMALKRKAQTLEGAFVDRAGVKTVTRVAMLTDTRLSMVRRRASNALDDAQHRRASVAVAREAAADSSKPGSARRRGSDASSGGEKEADGYSSMLQALAGDVDLGDIAQKGGLEAAVVLTEAKSRQWAPAVAAYETPSPRAERTPRRREDAEAERHFKEPTTIVLAPRTSRHRMAFDMPIKFTTSTPTEESGEVDAQQQRRAKASKKIPANLVPSVRLSKYTHVPGCQVCEGLPHYTLPDGTTCHLFHTDDMHELVADSVVIAPAPPMALQEILEVAFPAAPVFRYPLKSDVPEAHHVTQPPGVRPSKHTLPVKLADGEERTAVPELMGVLPDTAKLELFAVEADKPIVVAEPESESEEEPEPWTLYDSVFVPRLTSSDARDFFESDRVWRRAFTVDWGRVTANARFAKLLTRAQPDALPATVVGSIKAVMKKHYPELCFVFDYYATQGSGDVFCIQANAFYDMCADCRIINEKIPGCGKKDLAILFTAANVEENRLAEDSKANDDKALVRFEFIEMMLRIAIARFVSTGTTADIGHALHLLIQTLVLENADPLAVTDPDDYRRERLYTPEVNAVMEHNLRLLTALFKKYCVTKRDMPRKTLMSLSEWEAFLNDCELFSADFTRREAILCFKWSKMRVIDELKRQTEHQCMQLCDFLEALGRVAEVSGMPTKRDLQRSKATNAYEYFKAARRRSSVVTGLAARRPSSDLLAKVRTRPLAEKLQMLLDVILYRLNQRNGDGPLTPEIVATWPEMEARGKKR